MRRKRTMKGLALLLAAAIVLTSPVTALAAEGSENPGADVEFVLFGQDSEGAVLSSDVAALEGAAQPGEGEDSEGAVLSGEGDASEGAVLSGDETASEGAVLSGEGAASEGAAQPGDKANEAAGKDLAPVSDKSEAIDATGGKFLDMAVPMMFFNQFVGEGKTMIASFLSWLSGDDEVAGAFTSVINFLLFGGAFPGQEESQAQPIMEELANIHKLCEEILSELKDMEAELNASQNRIEGMIAQQSVEEANRQIANIWQSDVLEPERDLELLDAAKSAYKAYADAALSYREAYDKDANSSATAQAKSKYDSAENNYKNKLTDMYRRIDTSTGRGNDEADYIKMLTSDQLNLKFKSCLDTMTKDLTHTTKGSMTYVDTAAEMADKYIAFSHEQYEYVDYYLNKQLYEIMQIELIYEDLVSRQVNYSGNSEIKSTVDRWVDDFGEKTANFGKAVSAILSGYNQETKQTEYIYVGTGKKLLYSQYMRPADVYTIDSSSNEVTSTLVDTVLYADSSERHDKFGNYWSNNSYVTDYNNYEPFKSANNENWNKLKEGKVRYRYTSAGLMSFWGVGFYGRDASEYSQYLRDEERTIKRNAEAAYYNGGGKNFQSVIDILEAAQITRNGYTFNTENWYPTAGFWTKADKTAGGTLKFHRAAVTGENGLKLFYILDGNSYDTNIKNLQNRREVCGGDWGYSGNETEYILPNCDYYNLLYTGYSPSFTDGNSNRFGLEGTDKLWPLFNTNAFSLKGNQPQNYLSNYVSDYASGKTLYLLTPSSSYQTRKNVGWDGKDYGFRRAEGELSNSRIYHAETVDYNLVNMAGSYSGNLTTTTVNSADAYLDNDSLFSLILHNKSDEYKTTVSAYSNTAKASISVLSDINATNAVSSVSTKGGSVVKLRITPKDSTASSLSGMSLHLLRTFDDAETTTDEVLVSADDIAAIGKADGQNYFEIPVPVPYVEKAEYYLKDDQGSVQGVKMVRAGSFTAKGGTASASSVSVTADSENGLSAEGTDEKTDDTQTYDVYVNQELLTYNGSNINRFLDSAMVVIDENGNEQKVKGVYGKSDSAGRIEIDSILLDNGARAESADCEALDMTLESKEISQDIFGVENADIEGHGTYDETTGAWVFTEYLKDEDGNPYHPAFWKYFCRCA
ncbi:MAG: hypothetical protein IJT16_08365 [Lachnospiraceae bacterium]|nr:hypothetical protein [Lachnospiraceae bacterium]